jgi:L-fucose mutarotase
MLKNIPPILSPLLMKVLMEMGHGDELVIADGNFPSESIGKQVIRCDGHGVAALLEAVLPFFPLDTYAEQSVLLMEVVAGDTVKPVIWEEYRRIIKKNDSGFQDFGFIERFAFYERARRAYAVAATSESALYANIIVKKGVIPAS